MKDELEQKDFHLHEQGICHGEKNSAGRKILKFFNGIQLILTNKANWD